MGMSPRLLRPRASGFNPASISGLRAWWDASDSTTITLNATTVSQWMDKTGNAFALTQGTAANQPTYQSAGVNNKNTVRWPTATSGSVRLISDSFSMARPYTIFVCHNPANSGGALQQHALIDSYNNTQAATFTDGPSSELYRLAFGSAIAGPAIGYGTARAVIVTADAANQGSIRINSGTVSSGTVGTNTFSGLSVGHLRGNPSPLNTAYNFSGDMCEIVMYSAALSASQITTVLNYLASKWGFTA